MTEINGVKVVIWTLDQDKANSITIERFYECDSLHAQLKNDVLTMRQIKREDELQYQAIVAAYEMSEKKLSLKSQNYSDCQDQRENDQEQIKSLKKILWRDRGIGLGIIILILLI